MKKILITLLSFLLINSLSGCKDHNTTSASHNNTTISISSSTSTSTSQIQENTSMKIIMNINGHVLPSTLMDNESAKEFYKLVQNGLTLELSEYGGFEKVGPIGKTLPTNDTRITTKIGDLILYAGNQFSLMYGSNTWSYTKLGTIDNINNFDLPSILGEGDIIVEFLIK